MMNEFSLRIEPPRIIETNLDCTKKRKIMFRDSTDGKSFGPANCNSNA